MTRPSRHEVTTPAWRRARRPYRRLVHRDVDDGRDRDQAEPDSGPVDAMGHVRQQACSGIRTAGRTNQEDRLFWASAAQPTGPRVVTLGPAAKRHALHGVPVSG